MRLTNSGENLLRTAARPIDSRRPAISVGVRLSATVKPMSGCTSRDISRAPRLLVRKINVRSKLTAVLSPRLSVPLSRMPRSSTRQRRRRLLDFVEEHERQIAARRGDGGQPLLRQHRLGFAVPEVSRRRADQLRDLVVGLELAAVDLQHALSTNRAALPRALRRSASCRCRWDRAAGRFRRDDRPASRPA